MKPFALLLIAALTLPTFPAFAGGPAVVVDDPVPVAVAPTPVLDWSGFYAGLSADRATGTINDTLTDLDFDKATTDGAFAGYNWQQGNFVYGGELSYSPSFDLVVDPALAGGNDIIDNLLNLRARVGYAANRALFYGALGYSRGDMTVNGVREDANLSGMSASIGMDYLITDKIFAGLDYTRHNLDGTVDSLGVELKSDVEIISLRIGFKF